MFTQTDDYEVWQRVQQARIEVYDFLTCLKPDEWDTSSLCEGWRVRDVVGHLIVVYQYSPRQLVPGSLRSGLNINQFFFRTAIEMGNKEPAELLAAFENIIDHQKIPFFVPPLNALVDTMIHEQDMRLALGHSKPMPVESLHLIFSHWHPSRYNIGERITGIKQRTRGLKFVARDIDMTFGEGKEVIGDAQDVLLAIAGRNQVMGHLQGAGVAVLRGRQ